MYSVLVCLLSCYSFASLNVNGHGVVIVINVVLYSWRVIREHIAMYCNVSDQRKRRFPYFILNFQWIICLF